MEFLIRLVQTHEDFRLAELEALAAIAGVHVEMVSYSKTVRSMMNTCTLFSDKCLVTFLHSSPPFAG